jgi:hypothetical protein
MNLRPRWGWRTRRFEPGRMRAGSRLSSWAGGVVVRSELERVLAENLAPALAKVEAADVAE